MGCGKQRKPGVRVTCTTRAPSARPLSCRGPPVPCAPSARALADERQAFRDSQSRCRPGRKHSGTRLWGKRQWLLAGTHCQSVRRTTRLVRRRFRPIFLERPTEAGLAAGWVPRPKGTWAVAESPRGHALLVLPDRGESSSHSAPRRRCPAPRPVLLPDAPLRPAALPRSRTEPRSPSLRAAASDFTDAAVCAVSRQFKTDEGKSFVTGILAEPVLVSITN